MHDFAGQTVADVDHRRGFQAQIADLADDVHTRFWLELTLEQVREVFQFRLGRGCRLEHGLFPLQDLQTHVRCTQVSADHQQVAVACAVASHHSVRFHQAHGRHGQGQARRGGRGVAPNQIHLVDLASQANAGVQLLHRFHRKPVAQAQADHDLGGHRVHRTDVGQVHHHRLVAQVLQRRVAQVEVNAFAQHVGADHHALAHGVNHRAVVPHATKRGRLLVGQFFGHSADQAKLPQVTDFRAFHAAKVRHGPGRT